MAEGTKTRIQHLEDLVGLIQTVVNRLDLTVGFLSEGVGYITSLCQKYDGLFTDLLGFHYDIGRMDQFGERLDRLESSVEDLKSMVDAIFEGDFPLTFCRRCQMRRHRHAPPRRVRDVICSNSPTAADSAESCVVPMKRRFSRARDYRREMRRHLARPTGVVI